MWIYYKVNYPHYNQEFVWHEGPGTNLEVLHCDKCGKELITTDKLLEYSNIKCNCGGYYDKEVPIICPNCRMEISHPRPYITNATEWA